MNSSGEMLEEYNYDPWGRRRNAADWSYSNVFDPYITQRGFTGHEHLDMFNLIHMNGRIYDPVISRFLSLDPFIQDPYYLLNYNRYTYCLNNPLKYIDPSGYNFLKKLFGFFKNRSNKEGNQNSESTSYDDEQGGGWMPVGTGFNYVPRMTYLGGVPVVSGIDIYGGVFSDVVIQGDKNNPNSSFTYNNRAFTLADYPSLQMKDNRKIVGFGMTDDFTLAVGPIGISIEIGTFRTRGEDYNIFSIGHAMGKDISMGTNLLIIIGDPNRFNPNDLAGWSGQNNFGYWYFSGAFETPFIPDALGPFYPKTYLNIIPGGSIGISFTGFSRVTGFTWVSKSPSGPTLTELYKSRPGGY